MSAAGFAISGHYPSRETNLLQKPSERMEYWCGGTFYLYWSYHVKTLFRYIAIGHSQRIS